MARVFTFVEVDIDRCAHEYSVAPCSAEIGVTGPIKCFKSLRTCQDRVHFSNEPETVRFAKPTLLLPKEIDAIPSIKTVAFTPGTVSLGENLGQRATLTVVFSDHPSADTGMAGDPYRDERGYDPYLRGSFWGKFRARHPFVRGRAIRLITGYEGQALGEMETRHYVLDSFDGPNLAGEYTLVAKDVLKLADGDRAQAPRVSNGYVLAGIDEDDTGLVLAPSGIGDEGYPASGFVNIGGSEICSFTRSGDNLTLTRAQLGTSARTHAAEERVQIVLRFVSEDPADLIALLLEDYAGVDPAFMPVDEWLQETQTYFARLFTGTVANPTSVSALVSEIIEQAGLALWWNDQIQKIGLQVLRPVSATSSRLSLDNIEQGATRIKEQPDRRVSRVQTYYAQKNPLTSLTDVANYSSLAETADEQSEEDNGSSSIKTIFSRWIPFGGRPVALRINAIQLARFSIAPRKINWAVIRNRDVAPPALAQGHLIEAQPFQDATGAPVSVPIQNTQINPKEDRIEVESQEILWTQPVDDIDARPIIIDTNSFNINLRALYDTIYPEPVSGNNVTCTIPAGILVGSVNPSLRSFEVGDWPEGVSISLIIRGRIQGAGGKGGNSNVAGQNGGPALYTRVPVSIDFAGGQIWGGAGGGGGGGQGAGPGNQSGGGGGGGGAGFSAGAAGRGGDPIQVSGPPWAQPGSNGFSGTDTAGGDGNSGGDGGILGTDGGRGGDGGDPGQPGQPGTAGEASTGSAAQPGWPGQAGGAAGAAIDGDSFVTIDASGDLRGAQIN